MILGVFATSLKSPNAPESMLEIASRSKGSDRVQKNCPRTAIEKSPGNAGYSGPAGDLAFNERIP